MGRQVQPVHLVLRILACRAVTHDHQERLLRRVPNCHGKTADQGRQLILWSQSADKKNDACLGWRAKPDEQFLPLLPPARREVSRILRIWHPKKLLRMESRR